MRRSHENRKYLVRAVVRKVVVNDQAGTVEVELVDIALRLCSGQANSLPGLDEHLVGSPPQPRRQQGIAMTWSME